MRSRPAFSYIWISVSILFVIAAVYAMLSIWTPLAYDDWVFMAEWRNANGDAGLSPGALLRFWKDIRLYDNGRLANTFSPLSTMFSPWKEIFPYLTGVFAAGVVGLTTFFSFGKGTVNSLRNSLRPLYVAVAWVAVFFFLPWRNSLFVADYSLNYIWAAFFTMIFMYYVIWGESKGWNIGRFVLALVLAFIAGGWHEGFAVPTVVGFIIYTFNVWLTRPDIPATLREPGRKDIFFFSPQWYLIGFFYAAVAAVFLFCPGVLSRSQRQFGVENLGLSYLKLFFDFLPVLFLMCLVAFMVIVPTLRKFLREAWRTPWFVVGSGIVVTGTLLSLLFTHQPRSAFWPDLMALVMIFILTAPIWRWLKDSRFNGYLAALALAVCMLPAYYVLSWQYELSKESESIISKMEKSESGTVYHDIIQGSDLPFLTLKMTNSPAWVTDFHYHGLKEFYGKPYPAVVPTELADTLKTEKLKGDVGALKAGGSIILPYETPDPLTLPAHIVLRDGEETDAMALSLPFLSASGRPMTYVLVYGIPVEDIIGISLPSEQLFESKHD